MKERSTARANIEDREAEFVGQKGLWPKGGDMVREEKKPEQQQAVIGANGQLTQHAHECGKDAFLVLTSESIVAARSAGADSGGWIALL